MLGHARDLRGPADTGPRAPREATRPSSSSALRIRLTVERANAQPLADLGLAEPTGVRLQQPQDLGRACDDLDAAATDVAVLQG